MPECFFAHLGGCEGRLVKAHLIPKQRIKREFRLDPLISDLVWDPRVWTWMCGGISGLGGHHGAFDAKQIRIRRDELPEGLEEFASEYGLEWSLDRDFGTKARKECCGIIWEHGAFTQARPCHDCPNRVESEA